VSGNGTTDPNLVQVPLVSWRLVEACPNPDGQKRSPTTIDQL
jgi:hypothetical protein